MKKYWIEGYGLVGIRKAREILKKTHITYGYDISDFDMRKYRGNLPQNCRRVFAGDL